MNTQRKLTAILGAWSCLATLAMAQESSSGPASSVLSYVADDVVATVYVDLSSIKLSEWTAEAGRYGVPQEILGELTAETGRMQRVLDQLAELGAGRACVLVRATDLAHQGFVMVVEVAEGKQPGVVAGMLSGLLAANQEASSHGGEWFLPRRVEAHEGVVLLAMDDEQLQRLKESRRAEDRADVRAALEAMGGADAGLVIFGDPDSRRVMREMFPALPAPFMEIDGRLIADDLQWGGLTISQPPELQASIVIEAADAAAAQIVEQAAVKGIELVKGAALAAVASGETELPIDPLKLIEGLGLLKPEIDGERITLTLGDDEAELTFVRDLLAPAVVAARQSATRSQRMNQFKQLALAMLNYENLKRTTKDGKRFSAFPAHASYDEGGRPLLSWRVHILPYLEESELYNRFRLNEPWDSEHNLKLVAQMPAAYADPDPVLRAKIGDGRTTYVVPYGEGTVFFGRDGTSLREIKDGTSRTVLCVETTPERAVVWTKPDDWQVNLEQPLAGVQRTDRKGFVAAFCDGHVRYFDNNVDPAVVRAALTIAGED